MSLRKQATTGMVWTFTQQFGNQLINFIVSMILARILLPEQFGLIGMIAIFISIGTALLDSGLTQSLIRSKELDQEDYSTVFYFNLTASILIYTLIFFTAPLIAAFYEQSILTPIIRLYCITFIISAFSAVQQARLTQKMDFKTQTIIGIPSAILSGIIGISMAYKGFGVWSLVWSGISGAFFSALQLWIYSKWRPSWVFNFTKFKEHFNFGYKLTLSGLLDKIFSNIYLIVIGKYFTAAQVGFYTRAQTTKQLPVKNISAALNKVTYPLFASIQDDDIRLKRVYSQLMQMVVFVVTPVMVLLAVIAEPLFVFLFTDKWLPAVPYFQILCATGILYPIHSYNLNVLKVKGRSDLFLRLEIIKKIVIIIAIASTIKFGIIAMIYGQVFTSIAAFFINTHYTGKFLNYTAWQQARDIFPTIVLAFIVGVIIYIIEKFILSTQINFVKIISGGLLGGVLYLGGAFFLKFSSFNNLRHLILKK